MNWAFIFHKMAFFIATAVKTSNLTGLLQFTICVPLQIICFDCPYLAGQQLCLLAGQQLCQLAGQLALSAGVGKLSCAFCLIVAAQLPMT
jgi:hypothetical protein